MPAYIGRLCTELRVNHENELGKCVNPLVDNKNYQKAVRFGDEKYKILITGYNDNIEERIAKEKLLDTMRKEEAKRKEVERIAEKFNKSIELIKQYQKDKPDISQKNSEMKKQYDIDIQNWQEAVNAAQNQYDIEVQNWQEKVDAIQNQANIWKSQKKCQHCGGEIGGFFSKSCKNCNKKDYEPIKLPQKPVMDCSKIGLKPKDPTYLTSNQEILNLSITLFGKKWKVLDARQDIALIISDDIIERRAYHGTYTAITWKDCDLRNYLNPKFFFNLPYTFVYYIDIK